MNDNKFSDARNRLIDLAGRTTQDIGMGRLIGQTLAVVYLSEKEISLDDIGSELGVSKGAVSITVRQLESFGLIQQAWKRGDRKKYYRTIDNFGKALQNGILDMMRSKLRLAGEELEFAEETLINANDSDEKVRFLKQRIARAKWMRKRMSLIIDNPLIRLIGK